MRPVWGFWCATKRIYYRMCLPNLGSGLPMWNNKNVWYKMKWEVSHPFAHCLCYITAASGMTFLRGEGREKKKGNWWSVFHLINIPVDNIQAYSYQQSLLLQPCLVHHKVTNFIPMMRTAVKLTLAHGSMISKACAQSSTVYTQMGVL